MPSAEYRPPAGFLTMRQAQERLGVSKATFQRIVRRRALVTHLDPRDTRVKLVKAEDVEQLTRPVPTGSDTVLGVRR